MTETCSYENCQKDSVTELEINDENRPVCHGHITEMVQVHTEEEDDKPGRYPVMTNSEDQAAWINTDKKQSRLVVAALTGMIFQYFLALTEITEHYIEKEQGGEED